MEKDVRKNDKKFMKRILKKSPKKKHLTQADIKKYSSNQLDHVILKVKENEKKYIMISVLIILLIFGICCYFIFTSVRKGTIHNTLRSGDLYIDYSETKDGLGDVINLVNVKPLKDEEGLNTELHQVKITNHSDSVRNYKLAIINDDDMIDLDNCSNYHTAREFIRYNIDGNVATLDNKPIVVGELKPNQSVAYDIRVWVSEQYNGIYAPHYHGRIVVKQYKTKEQ